MKNIETFSKSDIGKVVHFAGQYRAKEIRAEIIEVGVKASAEKLLVKIIANNRFFQFGEKIIIRKSSVTRFQGKFV